MVIVLVDAISNYLDLRGYWIEHRHALETGILAAQQQSDRKNEGRFVNYFGVNKLRCGDYATALTYWEQSLAIQREIGDKAGEGITLSNLGATYSDLKQVDLARKYLQDALAIFEALQSPNANIARQWLAGLDNIS
ncbi:hypothetical protein CCP3SC1_10082 [Gammaproteobacteria bacterium]